MKKVLSTLCFLLLALTASAQSKFKFGTKMNRYGEVIEVDKYGFIRDGKHILPVMGEIHYSRVPREDWRREIRKMKAGGITILSTYVFWIHHEEKEGVWDWSGNKDLRDFLQTCRLEGMPVVLRVGPFCHGEVYQGGFPVWLTDKVKQDEKRYKLRSTAFGFMNATERLFYNIYGQVNGLLWKDGGPIVGIQIENECRGPWDYYKELKNMLVKIGFDVPFYTRTGWPKLNGKEEFGQMLPLFGDYADGFWDRKLTDMPGAYAQAFIMKDERMSRNIATETFSQEELNGASAETKESQTYPYLTCELGGGMMPSYHRRINMSGREPLPLAICKVGSGSNMPGYYMYHGGTNPYNPDHSMAEMQNSATTAHNDMPYMSYDFQCPLGEMGQPNWTAFHQTRHLHLFLDRWGGELSQMDVDTLSEHYARRGCFEFYNDYVRILNEEGVSYVRPVGMDYHGHKITADAQPLCEDFTTLYLKEIKGKKPIVWVDGKAYNAKLNKPFKVKDIKICVLSEEKANTAYLIGGELKYALHGGILYEKNFYVGTYRYAEEPGVFEEYWDYSKASSDDLIGINKSQEAGPAREVKMGAQKVAEQPSNEDFDQAAIYQLDIDKLVAANSKGSTAATDSVINDIFLSVNYAADCARVYADGQLVMDNFWNGKPMLVRLSDLVGKKVELRILPLRKDAPIYLQKEQKAILDAANGNTLLQLNGIGTIKRNSVKIKDTYVAPTILTVG